jgi:hypothetical protein
MKTHRFALCIAALALLVAASRSFAQAPPAADPAKAAAAQPTAEGPLAPLAWLSGCWKGSANQREFREQWMPLAGTVMLGVGHTTQSGQTQDYEYLRIEPRADGIYYVALPSKQKETAFKLGEIVKDDADTIFTFSNPTHDFPQRIVYRRGLGGWLYAHAEGTLNGTERKIIYPMRRVSCESDEVIPK